MAHIEQFPLDQARPEPRVLLVEGQNDKHVVWQLCRRFPEGPDFLIRDRDNLEQLLESIGAELAAPGLLTFGIMVDADTDPAARWDAVFHRLSAAGLALPRVPQSGGAVIATPGQPRAGVWIMPDNAATGELEDFVARMIPPQDPVWPRAQEYIDRIPQSDRKFSQNKLTRAQVHAWLATREQPRQMGSAIHARDLQTNGPLCQTFVHWLQRLFG